MAIMIDGNVVKDVSSSFLTAQTSTNSVSSTTLENQAYALRAEEAAEEAIEQANLASSAVSYIELLLRNFTDKYTSITEELQQLTKLYDATQPAIQKLQKLHDDTLQEAEAFKSSVDTEKEDLKKYTADEKADLKIYIDSEKEALESRIQALKDLTDKADISIADINNNYYNLVRTYEQIESGLEEYADMLDEVRTKHDQINTWYNELLTSRELLETATAVANKVKAAEENVQNLYNSMNMIIHSVAKEEIQNIIRMAMIAGGVSCGEQVWTVPYDIPANTIIVIPNGLAYIVGRHHLRIAYDGVVIPIGGFEEVGAIDSYSNKFITKIPLTKGQEIDAWVHHLAKDESKQEAIFNRHKQIQNGCDYTEFTLDEAYTAGTILRLPDNFEYVAGRHQFFVCVNHRKLAPGQYHEVGDFNKVSKYFVINVDIPAGSRIYAWTHHLFPQRMNEIIPHKHGNVFVHINGYEPEMPYIAYKFGASPSDNIPVFTDAAGNLLKKSITNDNEIFFEQYTKEELQASKVISAASGIMFVTIPGVGATSVEIPLDSTAKTNHPFIIETEESWVADKDYPVGSYITLPNGMLYVVDRYNLFMAVDGKIMSCATRVEIGVSGGLSNQIITTVDIKAGQLLNAWTRHPVCTAQGNTNVYTRLGKTYATVGSKQYDLYARKEVSLNFVATGYEFSYPLCVKYTKSGNLTPVFTDKGVVYVYLSNNEYLTYAYNSAMLQQYDILGVKTGLMPNYIHNKVTFTSTCICAEECDHSCANCQRSKNIGTKNTTYVNNTTLYIYKDGNKYPVYSRDYEIYATGLIPVYNSDKFTFTTIEGLEYQTYAKSSVLQDNTCPINAFHFGLVPVYTSKGIAFVSMSEADKKAYAQVVDTCQHTPICLAAANQNTPLLAKDGTQYYITRNGIKYPIYTKGSSLLLNNYATQNDFATHWNYDASYLSEEGEAIIPIYYVVGKKHLHISIDGDVLYPSEYSEVGKEGEVSNRIRLRKSIQPVTHWFACTHHVEPPMDKIYYIH